VMSMKTKACQRSLCHFKLVVYERKIIGAYFNVLIGL